MERKKKVPLTEAEELGRIRSPRGNELFGIVEARLGFGHMSVACADKKVRVCRVPGRLRRQLWLRVGDLVLVEPWQFESERKGDIVHKYTPIQAQWLRSKGALKDLGL